MIKRIICVIIIALSFIPSLTFASDQLNVEKYKTTNYKWSIPTKTPPKGEHPRLFLRKGDIATLKKNASSDPLNAYYKELMDYTKNPSDGILPNTGKANSNEIVLRQVEALAYRYVINGEKEYGPIAIKVMNNYLNTVLHSTSGDFTRNIGETIYVAAIVYDWCYDIMDTATKQNFIDKMMTFMGMMEIKYPPVGQSIITSHASEAQLLRDQLSVAIAIYDELPDVYNNVAGRFFDEYVEAREYFYKSHMSHQGDYYSYYRYRWDLFARFIFDRMGITDVFSENQTKIPYRYIYNRRPDGQILKDGDSSYGAQKTLGSYWDYIFETMMAASISKDPYLQGETYRQMANVKISLPFWMLMFFDPEIEPKSLSDLPLTKLFPEPMGVMTARTGWDLGIESDSVVADMKILGTKYNNHAHQDSGTFQIYYKGGLAVEAGMYQGINGLYASDHDKNYNKRTIAHNGMLVYDPNEQFYFSSSPVVNDGGQKLVNNGVEFLTMDEMISKGAEVATVLSSEFGPSKEIPYYSHIKGDITNAYSDKMEEFLRSYVFLNTGDEDIKGIMFVYDKVVSSNKDFKKTYLLHSVEEPNIEDNKITIKRTERGYDGKLTNNVVYPTLDNLTTNITEGYKVLDKEFPQQSNNPGSADAVDSGKYRVEVSPKTPQKEDIFLNVLQVMDGEVKEAEVLPVSSNEFVGAKVANNAVLFSKNGKKKSKTARFSVEGQEDEEIRFVVTDLEPGYWQVIKEGEPKNIYQYEVTEDGGVLQFNGKGGNYTLVQYDALSMLKLPLYKLANVERKEASLYDVRINSKYSTMNPTVYKKDDKFVFPLRKFFNSIGYEVTYDEATKTIQATNDTNKLVFYEGSKKFLINEEEKNLDFELFYKNSSLMLPIDKLSKYIDVTINYRPLYSLIDISAPNFVQGNTDKRSHRIKNIVSSGDDGNVISNVLDGDFSTRWSAEGLGQYAIFDLGESKEISEVGIAWNNGHLRKSYFEIYVSDGNKNYTKIYDGASNGKTIDLEYHKFDKVNARYVKLVCNGNDSAGSKLWNSITEVVIRKP